MILSFLTYMIGQTVLTQVRLLLDEQSDLDPLCLLFYLHHMEVSHHGRTSKFEFKNVYIKFTGCLKILNFRGQLFKASLA